MTSSVLIQLKSAIYILVFTKKNVNNEDGTYFVGTEKLKLKIKKWVMAILNVQLFVLSNLAIYIFVFTNKL